MECYKNMQNWESRGDNTNERQDQSSTSWAWKGLKWACIQYHSLTKNDSTAHSSLNWAGFKLDQKILTECIWVSYRVYDFITQCDGENPGVQNRPHISSQTIGRLRKYGYCYSCTAIGQSAQSPSLQSSEDGVKRPSGGKPLLSVQSDGTKLWTHCSSMGLSKENTFLWPEPERLPATSKPTISQHCRLASRSTKPH